MLKNENRPGYKKTKVGWIPEDWQCSRLENAASVITGPFGAQLHEYDYVDEGTPIVTVEHLGELGLIHKNLPLVSDIDKTRLSRYVLKKGDIVFSRVGSVDRNSLVSKREDGWLCSGRLLRVRPHHEFIYPPYLNSFFHQRTFKNHMQSIAVGGTMACLNTGLLSRVFINMPPLPEQKAIAGVLDCWDKAIRNYEKKIEKKRNIKKGLMQRLLSGKQRLPGFSGEWKEVMLGDIGRFSKGKGISKEEVSDTGLPCIRYGEIYTSDKYIINSFRSFISSKQATQCTLIKQNDLLLAGSGETIDEIGKSIAYMSAEEAYAGGDIIIFSASAASARGDYLSFYLNTEGRQALGRLGQGQSVVHIYARNIASLCIPLPGIEEQKAIANVLSAADGEIEALERKLAALKDQKKYLLNNLVTGTIRLPQFRSGMQDIGSDGDDR